MREKNELVHISKFFGEYPELVQAGGGNSSVKVDDEVMLIKSSGYPLADISMTQGVSEFNYKKAISSLQEVTNSKLKTRSEYENLSKRILSESISGVKVRPSIEVFLHCFTKKYTVHLHPIWITGLLSSKLCSEILSNKLDGHKKYQWTLIEYKTPGIELGFEILKVIEGKKNNDIIFLKNHGLIFTADTIDSLFAQFVFLQMIFSRNKTSNTLIQNKEYPFKTSIREIMGFDVVILKTTNNYILDFYKNFPDQFYSKPLTPDDLIFWGAEPILIHELDDFSSIILYEKKFGEYPKVIVFEGDIFFCHKSLNRARVAEEVFKAHLMAKEGYLDSELNFLCEDEILYLLGWEAEVYRKNLNT